MNKVVIVTGASRGIGKATAILLAKQGYAVVVNYVKNTEAAKQLVTDITAAQGIATAIQADVSIEADVESLFAQTQQAFGQVTHLVNNAGIVLPQMPLADMTVERMQQILNTNINSVFLCCRQAARCLANNGAIVNVSSVAARTGSPFEYVDYAASKGAVDALTKGLAVELADKNIRVNAVRPGFIKTTMHADGGEPNRVERLAPSIPLQRGGTTEEIAEAIAFLLSEQAAYITGTLLDVAGGR